MLGRGLFATRGFCSRLETIADAEIGDEAWIAHVVVELLADLAGIHAQVLRLGSVVRPPHLLEDRLVGQHPPGVAGEQGQEGELLGRQTTVRSPTVTARRAKSMRRSPTTRVPSSIVDRVPDVARSTARSRASSSGVEYGLVT